MTREPTEQEVEAVARAIASVKADPNPAYWTCYSGLLVDMHWCDHIGQARAALSAMPSGWRPIEEAEHGRKYIVGYRNSLGKWRSVMGRYYTAGTLESEHEDSGFAEEGWYEESETHEELLPLDYPPTHFMPLPSPPEPTP